MSKLKILGGEKQLDPGDVADFENNCGVQLPENYKKFILKHNGGYINQYHDCLSSFKPIKYGTNTVEACIRSLSIDEQLLPKEFIPIANQHFGNPITLCLREAELYGKIILFYFDRNEEPELVANSLEELLGVEKIEDL